ncbi:MAG: hypothetical protein L3J33_00465 [Rhodobacteraceae bacterium]|nr:hypothetical protein [Paracoccaceae bacterium]
MMKIVKAFIAGLGIFLVQPAAAQDADPMQVSAFLDLIADNGCSMTEAEAEIIFPANGFDKSLTREIATALIDQGVVAFESEILRIIDGSCDINSQATRNIELTADQALFIGILAPLGCRMTEEQMKTTLPENGMSARTGDQMADELMDLGIAMVSEDRMSLTINADYCTPVASESPAPVENNGSLEGVFMSVMAQNDCRLTEIDARQLFPASGLMMEDVYLVADELVEAGLGYYSEDNTTLIITSPDCTDLAMAATPVEAGSDAPEVVVATPETSDDPEAQFLRMVAANACEITQANARDMTDAAGMDYNLAMGIASRMMNDGRASSPDGGQTLQILAPLCVAVGSGPMEPRDIFIEVLRGNNCTMTAGEFSSLLPVDGLDQNAAFGLITELEAEGVITLPPSRDVVTLTAGNCR